MKSRLAIFLAAALLTAGCSTSSEDGSVKENTRTKILNVSSSYFDQFSSEEVENAYVVKGIVHKENDENAVIAHIRAEEDVEISIRGTMEKDSGADTELVYIAPDGTETKLTDSSLETFETTLEITAGDGVVRFKGKPAVYEFEVQFEVMDGVNYSDL